MQIPEESATASLLNHDENTEHAATPVPEYSPFMFEMEEMKTL
jgi:hypothetical protein